eukprot:CCRYP_006432-RA/>CCRYP_006432-RA protein AED:0.22 eAED:0.22 QI:0/-1/0/1/-1/1/1/0/257
MWRTLNRATALLAVNFVIDGTGEILDLDDPILVSYLQARSPFHETSGRRYFKARKHRKSTLQNIFEDDLRECEDDTHWMNDVEFKKYRCSRLVLDKIVQKIETSDVFKRGTRGPAQMSVKYQLMLLLHFLGKEGESNSSQRNQFKVSYGATEKCRDRVVQSLIDIRNEYIKWPTENERKQIAQRVEQEFLLPNCIGLMDGTLLPLGIAPSCSDAADYSGRKFPYSLTVCVINDDKRKIRAYLSGFPGSTHATEYGET